MGTSIIFLVRRAQTSLEYLLIAAGVILLAVLSGNYVLSVAKSIVFPTVSVEGNVLLSLQYSPRAPTVFLATCTAKNTGASSLSILLDNQRSSICTIGSSGVCSLSVEADANAYHGFVCEANGTKLFLSSTFASSTLSIAPTATLSVNAIVYPQQPAAGQPTALSCVVSAPTIVSSVSVYLDNKLVRTCTPNTRTAVCSFFTVLPSGQHTLSCSATAGSTTTQNVTFSVESGSYDYPPAVEYISASASPGSVKVTCPMVDANGVKRAYVLYDNNNEWDCSPSSPTRAWTCNASLALSSGTHELTCIAVDTRGQWGVSTPLIVHVP